MNSKGRTILIVVAFVVVIGVAAYLLNDGKRSGKFVISGNIPLTGPVAAWSGQYPNGFTMGIDEACERFSVPRDSIEVDMKDNAGKPGEAVSVFQQQKLKGFDVYISGTSECSLAIAPQIDQTSKPHFTLAFDPFFVNDGPNRMRIQPNSRIEGPLFVRYAKAKAAKKVYGVTVNSSYANSEWEKIIAPGLRDAGIDIRHEAYKFDEKDFKTLALKVEQEKPDLIFVIGYSFHLQPLIRDLRTRGLVTEGRVMAALDYIDFLYQGLPKEELRGVVFACPSFEIPGKIPGAAEWQARYVKRFNKKPTYVEAYGYDAAGVLVKAIKEKNSITTETIRAVLPYDGVTGRVELNENRDLLGTVTLARVAANGQVEEVTVPE